VAYLVHADFTGGFEAADKIEMSSDTSRGWCWEIIIIGGVIGSGHRWDDVHRLGLRGVLVLACLIEVAFLHGNRARWVLGEGLGGETREVGDVIIVKDSSQGG
jgi:hypothetical protein